VLHHTCHLRLSLTAMKSTMRYTTMILVGVVMLLPLQHPAEAGKVKVLTSPALWMNPGSPGTDKFLCVVTNISAAPISVDVAIVDGTGSTTWCGGTSSFNLEPGKLEGVPCELGSSNFAYYCRVSTKDDNDVRANHCVVDSLQNVKVCSDVR